MPTHPLKAYLAHLDPAAREKFASRAETSVECLRITANGYRTGGVPRISAEFAARIERASKGELTRNQLSDTCRGCPFAKGAR